MTTTQAINAVMEVVVPVVMRYVTKSAAKARTFAASAPTVHQADEEDERAFLERIRREAELPEYSLFEDFAEMVVQVCEPPFCSSHKAQGLIGCGNSLATLFCGRSSGR
jgi:hypothetical protein